VAAEAVSILPKPMLLLCNLSNRGGLGYLSAGLRATAARFSTFAHGFHVGVFAALSILLYSHASVHSVNTEIKELWKNKTEVCLRRERSFLGSSFECSRARARKLSRLPDAGLVLFIVEDTSEPRRAN